MTTEMNPFPAATTVIGSIAQKAVIQNVGAKRILGTELVALGKVPQFVYYLVDISSIVFWANDNTNTWIGGFGHVVAGSLAQRDSLQPFQGQKFYIVDTDISYEFKGGVWEGGVIEANILAPTYLELAAPTTLSRGRSHLIVADGDYVLPLADGAEAGASLLGHAMEVVVARGNTVNLVQQPAEPFINDVSASETTMALETGNLYTIVYNGTKWEVYAAEVDGKLNKSTTIGVGDGIVKSGALGADTLILAADFATAAEAINPAVTNKVLAPSNISEAVTAATRGSQFNNITGLLPAATESKFLLTTNVDRTKVDYPEFTCVFNPDPFIRHSELIPVTVPAGQIVLPNSGPTPTSHFAKVNSSGVISLDAILLPKEAITEFHLGVIVEINGEVALGAGGDVINNGPWLASTETVLRLAADSVTGAGVEASATAGKVKMDAMGFNRESVNWEQSTVAPHIRNIGAVDPLVFTYLDRFGTVIGTLLTDEVDGQELDDTSTVGNNNFSIQVVYTSSEGTIAVLMGQVIYANIIEAQAAVESYLPIIPTILTNVLEVSRWIVKGNQYPGSGSLDLTDPSNFIATVGNSVTGGATSNAAINITSSVLNNTLTTLNVQEQIDELDAKTLVTLPAPLSHILATNQISKVSAPTGTDADVPIVRATIKHILDRYGILQEVAINELAVNEKGALLEGAGENFLANPDDASLWTELSGTFTTHVINGAIVGVDGNLGTVTEVTSATGDAIIRNGDLISGAIGEIYTGAFWVKADKITTITTAINALSVTVHPITTEWQRIENTATSTNANRYQDITFTDSTAIYYIDRGGIEESPFATSHISTGTRAADDLNTQGYNNVPLLNQPWSFSCELSDIPMEPNQTIFGLVGAERLTLTSGTLFLQGDGSSTSLAIGLTGTEKIAITYDGTTVTGYVNGVVKTSGAMAFTELGAAVIQYGARAGLLQPMHGFLKDPQWYHEELTANQVRLLP